MRSEYLKKIIHNQIKAVVVSPPVVGSSAVVVLSLVEDSSAVSSVVVVVFSAVLLLSYSICPSISSVLMILLVPSLFIATGLMTWLSIELSCAPIP